MGVKAASPRGDALGEFGEKFRKEREKKNFSLDDVAAVTKIGVRMLRAIEEEDFDRLPGGVFNKGFIRTYAKHLGMNDDKAVADYLACVRKTQIGPDPPAEVATATPTRTSPEKRTPSTSKKKSSPQPAPKSQASTQVEELPELQLPRAEHVRPPGKKYLDNRDTGIPWGLIAAAALVVVLALFLWNRHSRNARAEASAPPNSTPQAAPAQPQAPASYQTASAHSTDPAASRATMQSSVSTSATAVHPTAAKPPVTSSPTDAAATTPAPANPAPTPAPLTLIVRASENSWISVRADGQEVTAETLIAPAHTSFHATREIVVRTGNAAGINFLWNGKEIPAQGSEAEVRTLIFDAEGVHANSPALPPVQNQ
jgi:cytoskeleton protein RodZ